MPDGEDAVLTLHGDLELRIISARRLPDMDMFSDSILRCFFGCNCYSPSADPDPYVSLLVAGVTVARTRAIHNSQDPHWDERFLLPLAHSDSHIRFVVKDDDYFGAQVIGTVSIPASRVASGELIDQWFQVVGSNDKPLNSGSELHVSLQFIPMAKNQLYSVGIVGEPEKRGVQEAYFPVRKGGRVTLYQDAHVRPGELPEVEVEAGKLFMHQRCWEDICHAILEAHHLIYLVGWSIYDKVKLVREPSRPMPKDVAGMTLGELLKYKSQEGVRILMLVWDDRTSHDIFGIKMAGVMQTHDEETKKFFKDSSVTCILSPRYASSKLGLFKQEVVETLYTHHQKCVLVDTQGPGNNRRIIAFIGGLDLCDGRYDTPQHRLFEDLDTIFENDFHNPTFAKQKYQGNHGMTCTAGLRVQLHMMSLQILSSGGTRQQSGGKLDCSKECLMLEMIL